jgi:hypothetical protein
METFSNTVEMRSARYCGGINALNGPRQRTRVPKYGQAALPPQ